MTYYFTINEDGEALVICEADNHSWSLHSSNDETEGDGDGYACPRSWEDAYRWTETSREHASSMMKFDFSDDEESN